MKVKMKVTEVRYHEFIENVENPNTATRHDGAITFTGARITEAGCRRKIPAGAIFDGFETRVKVFEIPDDVVMTYPEIYEN